VKEFILLIVSIALVSCTQDKTIDINSLSKQYDIPSAVMGKINKDGTSQFYSFGPSRWDRNDTINERSIYRIASMTKAIAVVAALQLVEQNKITLDEPLDDILPEMSSIKILDSNNQLVSPKTSITLRHLLTHTAGFGYWFTSNRLKNWSKIKEEIDWDYDYQPRLFESGSSFMYGTNIDWVGVLIEKVSGMNLEDYLRENVTGPLGMDSTWFNVPENLHPLLVGSLSRDRKNNELTKNEFKAPNKVEKFNAGGGLYSSAEDYGKFLLCMLNKGKHQNGQLINEETFDLMNTPQLSEFKQIWRNVDVPTIDINARGDKDSFMDSFDNWTLAWAYDENSEVRPKGTAYWAGYFNTYFTIDFKNEFALVYMSQLLPFNDYNSYNLFTSFEEEIYNQQSK